MSLFDTIRYPINDYPTKEVLDCLPEQLFKKWVKLSDFDDADDYDNEHSTKASRNNVAYWYSKYHGSIYFQQRDYDDIELLRKMIQEYEV